MEISPGKQLADGDRKKRRIFRPEQILHLLGTRRRIYAKSEEGRRPKPYRRVEKAHESQQTNHAGTVWKSAGGAKPGLVRVRAAGGEQEFGEPPDCIAKWRSKVEGQPPARRSSQRLA